MRSEQRRADLRVIVVGGRILACVERRSEGGFKRTSPAGARSGLTPLTHEIEELALDVTARLGLDVVGIDLLSVRTASWSTRPTRRPVPGASPATPS